MRINSTWIINWLVVVIVFVGITELSAQTKASDKEWAAIVEAAIRAGLDMIAICDPN